MSDVLKMAARRILALAPLLLAGCAAGDYCEGKQGYQEAPSVPPIQSVEGLQLKESTSALKIPPPPETQVPYGEAYRNEKGEDAVRCLDQPPAMPPPPLKPGDPVPSETPPATPPAQPG